MAITPSPWRGAALLLVLAACGAAAWAAVSEPAQRTPRPGEPYALIFGTVWDPDGVPVHGVEVRIRPAERKRPVWRLTSDRRGEFAQRLPAGKAEYVVWAELPRPRGQKREQAPPRPEVRVNIEYDERVDISLHLKQTGTPQR